MSSEDFDEVEEIELLGELIVEFKSENSNESLKRIEAQLKKIDKFIKQIEKEGEYSEIYIDYEFELSPILNGADFRVDNVADLATNNTDLFDLIYDFIAKHNENIEVVLAINPYISETLKWKLAESEFEWEEDGTREALARNHSDGKLLTYLAEVGNVNVKHQVALNPKTPVAVLDSLANETEPCNFQMEECLFGELTPYRGYARWCVVNNPNTGLETLKKVVEGKFSPINPEVDQEIKNVALAKL